MSSKRSSANCFGGACAIVVLLAVPPAPVSRSFFRLYYVQCSPFAQIVKLRGCKSVKSPAGSVPGLRPCVVHAYVAACVCACVCAYVRACVSFCDFSRCCLRSVIDVVTWLPFLLLLIACLSEMACLSGCRVHEPYILQQVRKHAAGHTHQRLIDPFRYVDKSITFTLLFLRGFYSFA